MEASPLTSPRPPKYAESPTTRLVSVGSNDDSMPGVPANKIIRPRSISRGKSGLSEEPSPSATTPNSRGGLRTSDPSPSLSSSKSFRAPSSRDESPDHNPALGGRRSSFVSNSRDVGGSKIFTNIQVAIRCRPINEYERKSGLPSVVSCDTDNNSIKVIYGAAATGKKPPKHLVYDKVFGTNSRQDEVYDSVVQPIVEEALVGFNCTVFAYGPTGTGKTYTMEGDITSEENCGLIPRAGKYLLETLQQSNADFTLKASFLEIYNEELEDLLSFTNDKRLRLCEDLKRGVICQHLEEFPIVSTQDIYELLRRGIANRQSHSTATNLSSSRSHAIFSFRISIKESDLYGEEIIKTGQLNLVDLAGSECIGRSGATNERAREAGSINQSLLTLGRVITALVDHHSHIPYRDSKLTRLLQESLGGKTKTCIIATVSPSQLALEDSLSTLDYAYRAKNIKNQPTVNLQIQQKVVMKEYSAEIETLKSLLSLARDKNGVYLDPAEYTRMEAKLATQDGQLQELELTLRQREDEINELRDDQSDLINRNNDLKAQLDSTAAALEELQQKHQQVKIDLHETYIDLKSTEAVVEAQTETEGSLTSQGMELIKDLTARQTDVDTLLAKVDRMSEVESDRTNLTSTFLSSLNSSSAEILTSVQQLSSQSAKNATKLHSGIEQVLLCSKDTCETLQGSINASLAELREEAKAARDSMSHSCVELNANLGKTNDLLESTLRNVQQQLTSWLNDTSSSLLVALQHIDVVQSQVSESSKVIGTHCAALKEASIGFSESQEALKADVTRNAVNLKLEFKRQLDAYKAETEISASEAESLLKNKANALEQAVSSMLKDLVLSHSQSVAAAKAVTELRCGDIETQVNLGVNQAIAGVAIMQSANSEHSVLVQGMADSCKIAFASHVEAVSVPLKASASILSEVTTNATAKSTELDESIDGLLKEVDLAIEEGYAVVRDAQKAGDKVVTDVNESVSRVNAEAQQCMESFVSVMSSETESIAKELNKHFKGLDSHSTSQTEGLHAIKTKAASLSEKLSDLVVVPSGSTPEKTYFRKRAPLSATRDHATIKREQRDLLLLKLQDHLQSGGTLNGDTSSPYLLGASPGRSPQASPLHVLYDRGGSPRSTPISVVDSNSGGSGEKKLRRTGSKGSNR